MGSSPTLRKVNLPRFNSPLSKWIRKICFPDNNSIPEIVDVEKELQLPVDCTDFDGPFLVPFVLK